MSKLRNSKDSEKVIAEEILLERTLHDRFENFIISRKLRRTSERFAILERVVRLKAHFEVEDLYEMMEKEGYHVSRATVYNTIGLLCECGILRRLLFDKLQARYELASANHLHLVCTRCGQIREINDSVVLADMNRMKFPRFTTSGFSATIYGTCSKCRRTQTMKSKRKRK